MAWQAPKTNWSAADGVRDTDMNRIEGNILELYNVDTARANKTIYVTTTGNDISGNGTSASPYATITRALQDVPKNIGNYTVTIDVGAGTYADDISIKGINGTIIFSGAYGASVSIRSLTVDNCVCSIQAISLSVTTSGITVTNNGVLLSVNGITISNSAVGITVTNNSAVYVNSTVTVYDATTASILVTNLSKAFIYTIAGATSNALTVEKGSVASYVILSSSITTAAFITMTGGRIFEGAQILAPKY